MKPLSHTCWAVLVSSSVLSIALAGLLVLPDYTVWMYQGASGSGTDYCVNTTAPGNADQDTEQTPFIELSLLPFGISCDWMLVDGSYATVAPTNPLPSLLLYGGITGICVALVSAVHRTGRTE